MESQAKQERLERIPQGYEVTETLYRSTSKVVYRAIRKSDGLPVVLKCLERPSPHTRRRMDREVSFLRRLQGAGVCAELVDYLKEEAVIILADHGDVRSVLQVSLLLARSLNVAHGHRICHNDMKPRNFLYLHHPTDPRIVLLDFDLASNFEEVVSSESQAIGTIEYMSPEQTGQIALPRDYRTDLYTLGVIMHQLCTGSLPYTGSNTMEMFLATISAQPPPVTSVNPLMPQQLTNIITMLLNKNPDQRYQSAFGLVHDLERCVNDWKQRGVIELFELRERDCPVVFRIPMGIFGRETELAVLHSIYEHTRFSRLPRNLLIGGPAGVGKSSVLSTLQSGFHGIYVTGKYELIRGETPYWAFTQAINMLARHILVMPPPEQQMHRAAIMTAVGTQGAVLTSVFTDLERLIGEQPAVPDLPPSESQNRVKTVFLSFIRALATTERPLILFLDDLQWADTSSLVLWRALLSAEVTGLMIVCAYRDNEVPPGHPFDQAIKDVTGNGVVIQNLSLRPIAAPAIVSILSTAIKLPPVDAQPLAELLLHKTLGNPFFLNRYIKALYEEQLLYFNWHVGHWQYDAEKIAKSTIAENAAQLMTASLQKLDPAIRDTLLKASCIGTQFGLQLLNSLSSANETELRTVLMAAVDQAYIFNVGPDTWRFCHDNVHSAAHALLTVDEKKTLHLLLGRAMQQILSENALEDSLFELLSHLNSGSSLITSPEELLQLAQLNRAGSQKAFRATATVTAGEYANVGLEALGRATSEPWTTHHKLAFTLSLDKATSLALSDKLDQACEEFSALALRASTPTESLDAYGSKMLYLHMNGKHKECCAVGIQCLTALGDVALPLEPTNAEVDTILGQFDAVFNSKPFEEFARMPAATNAEVISRERCLGTMTAPAFFYQNNFCALISARNSILSLTQGVTHDTGIGLVFLAMVYGIREKFEQAFDVGRLAVALADRFDDINAKGRVYFMFGAHINWFRKPIWDDLSYLRVACKYLLSSYDYTYASYATAHNNLTWVLGCDNLETALHESKTARDLLKSRIYTPYMAAVLDGMVLTYVMLTQGTPAVHTSSYFASPEIVKFDTYVMNETTPLTVSWWLCVKCFGLYCLERYEEAVVAGKANEEVSSAIRGHLMLPYHYYPHYILAMLAVYTKTADVEARDALLVSIKKVMGLLNVFARQSPANLAFIELVVRGRYQEVVESDLPGAAKHYDHAAADAEKVKSHYWQGLALSMGYSCSVKNGTPSISRMLLREACTVWTSWGAATLVALISRHYSSSGSHTAPASQPNSISGHGSSSSSSGPSATLSPFVNLNAQLDADTVLQVARALSQEIVLEKLLSEVMRIITENTSAELVCLAMQREGTDLEIVTSKKAGTVRAATTIQNFTLASADKITADIIRFVHTLSEGILLENAYLDPRFCPEGRPLPGLVRSVLCVPILKGSIKAVLYMENTTVAAAFSPARMGIVHAILPQIAISIENAQLVKRLTNASEELKRKNEALRQDDMRKDQFLAITTHELRTPLHGVIGATSLLLETSPLSTEQQEYASVILGASKSLLTLVNDILDLTKIQSQKVTIEPRTSSVISIVEAALEVVSGAAAHKELELAYTLSNSLPSTHLFKLDPVRVQQVLTNLLANAIKFTRTGHVLLTVSADGPSEEEINLKFVVSDTGIGIPPDKIPRLFQMFSQLDAPEKNNSRYDGYGIISFHKGVGLFICQRLLELQGGSINAYSDGKNGSTFTVTIPSPAMASLMRPRIDQVPPKIAAVLYFGQRHSYEFIIPPLLRFGLGVFELDAPANFAALVAKIPSDHRIVFFTDLALAAQLPPDRSLGTIVLAYPQKWKLYLNKNGLVPLFRPVQHSKILIALQSLIYPTGTARRASVLVPPLDISSLQPASAPLGPSSSRDSKTPTSATPSSAPVPTTPRLHVLVVEDNLVNAKLLCRILEGTYTTGHAINGVEAIKAVCERAPSLILMDIQMPVMDGIQATKELRRLGYSMPIVAATASFSDSDRATCIDAGMDDVLPKPFTKPAVLATVLRNLRTRDKDAMVVSQH